MGLTMVMCGIVMGQTHNSDLYLYKAVAYLHNL